VSLGDLETACADSRRGRRVQLYAGDVPAVRGGHLKELTIAATDVTQTVGLPPRFREPVQASAIQDCLALGPSREMGVEVVLVEVSVLDQLQVLRVRKDEAAVAALGQRDVSSPQKRAAACVTTGRTCSDRRGHLGRGHGRETVV